MTRDLKIAIPLKTNSDRVPNKNLRPFHNGKSLFDIKAEQLLKTFSPKDIYVSSENPGARKIVEEYGFHFHLRDDELAQRTRRSNWAELTEAIIRSIPGTPDILWVQVTQPLYNEFDKLVDAYKNLDEKKDSIAVVVRQAHHLLDELGNPVNFNFGYWHKISQDLPKLYQVAWAAFIMRREMMDSGAYYQIGRNPLLLETCAPLVDIDTVQDFEVAGILYNHYMTQK